MVECPRKYRNLGSESFGEQKYVTADMLHQFCKNDAYLKGEADELRYLTPTAVRQEFRPVPIDAASSWNCKTTTENIVVFDDSPEVDVIAKVTDQDLIDYGKSTCHFRTFSDRDTVTEEATLPYNDDVSPNNTTKTMDQWMVSAYWYLGYDEFHTEYELRENWLNLVEMNTEIPSIARAQTFKPKVSGELRSVTLALKTTEGSDWWNTGSPLYVQIRKTEDKDGIPYPVHGNTYADPDNTLAEEKIRVNDDTQTNFITVQFTTPPVLEEDKHYALVLASPLSRKVHTYWVGGKTFEKNDIDLYTDGHAFYSHNTGWDWTIQGEQNVRPLAEDVTQAGDLRPCDFFAQFWIDEHDRYYKADQEYYVYLKPIVVNPIRSVTVSGNDTGDEELTQSQRGGVRYEVSHNGIDWHDVSNGARYNFESAEGITPSVLFVRGVLTPVQGQGDKVQVTPTISQINVAITKAIPYEMYLRTPFFIPPTEPMLGANQWGRINTPVELDRHVTCEIEIIPNSTIQDTFQLIDSTEILRYADLVPKLDADRNSVRTDDKEACDRYLRNNPEVIKSLGLLDVYVVGFMDNGIALKKDAARPLIDAYYVDRTGKSSYLGEWYDYTVDYVDNKLYINENTKIYLENDGTPRTGTLRVSYNPVFLRGLDPEDMPLVLDVFQESFIVTTEMLASTRIKLKSVPIDPIRSVEVNPDTEFHLSLEEDVDYHFDRETNELVIDVLTAEEEDKIINANDKIVVTYNPSLRETGISVGYWINREYTSENAAILPSWIEYKT